MVGYFFMPSWLLVFEFIQEFTNLLAWIDSASFNQFVLVGAQNSCFQVYIEFWIYYHLLQGHFNLIFVR